MNNRKIYWFKLPKDPDIVLVAVQPFIDPEDGRLTFYIPNEDVWRLPGKMIADTEDKIVYDCSLHAHGGIYELNVLTLQEFRKTVKRYVAEGDTIARVCKNTDDLHYWYRKNWSYPNYWEYEKWKMEDNTCRHLRTDPWNRDMWSEREKRVYDQEQERLKEYEQDQKHRLAEYEKAKSKTTLAATLKARQ